MTRLGWSFCLVVSLLVGPLFAQTSEGVLPLGPSGKPLNLDFETGDLRDWIISGEAFVSQPIKGDTVYPRRADNKSQHQGQFWIGGFERKGDKPQGTLISVPFKVTHPWGSFLVGGGPHEVTCVELVRKDSNKVFFRASGLEEENMRRVVVDLKDHLNQEMFIRLVDRHSGHWGHVNFDDFRFHAEKPKIIPRPAGPAAADVYKFAGLPPAKAAMAMTVPEGFEVKLFAGEPDVVQPIAMCLDDRGRLWVVEGHCYPIRRNAKDANDRILIFEDVDGDGRFDKKTVFMEGLNLVSGIEVGFGGVWIGAAPYFMFVPMKDDKPAGEPKILLDGWGWQDTHETLNSFIWGPDGWLYGCHGVFTHSRVGKPGTPQEERLPINAGIWRYHPTKHVFEVFAHGTSNPWGFDFNDHGQGFCEACVIPHCFHIIQGARYNRQAGPHFNPHTYAGIQTIADHRHYLTGSPHGGNNRSDSAGGGHAHCGLMCYLGGTWPAKYRNQLFMGNIHGRRFNMDVPAAKGSGYVAGHGPDFLLANDAWARFIYFTYGPDGNVFLIDWYDKQACHHGDPKIWDRSNGRIYKICYREAKPVRVDLGQKTDLELVEMQLHANDWYVRHARRLLQERGASTPAVAALQKIAFAHPEETRRLRGLWALHVTGNLPADGIRKALGDASPFVRSWALQLALEPLTLPSPPRGEGRVRGQVAAALLEKMAALAQDDPAPVVRLYLASALQRLPRAQRWAIAANLLAHSEDAADHNLPLMYWYGVEPLAEEDPARALELAARGKIPQILAFMVRRIGSAGTPQAIGVLVDKLAGTEDANLQLAFLRGLQEALKGRRNLSPPASWATVFGKLSGSTNGEIRSRAADLAVTFGDVRALAELRKLLLASKMDVGKRREALASLVAAKDPQLPPLLHKLLGDTSLRGEVLRSLAVFDHPHTPAAILDVYPALTTAEKRDALATLAARVPYAQALLEGIAAKRIAATDVSADILRQLRNLQNKSVESRLAAVWGVVRDTPADRLKLIAHYKKLFSAPAKAPPDLALGRAMFARTCQQCHTLFGSGGKIGPDITGSNRADLQYLLENIIDPSSVIAKEYAATFLELNDGRFITGLVKNETPAALTVLTANDTLTIPRADVAARKPSDKSMMPDDVIKQLKDHELRALVAYLQSPRQVPLLALADNVKDFFNGKDLAGWEGDAALWQVDKGELVGRAANLKQPSSLRSHFLLGDFRLTMEVKGLVGLVCDSETGKACSLLTLNCPDWTEVVLVASNGVLRLSANGSPVREEKLLSPRRSLAFRLPAGTATELRLRKLRLEVTGGQ